MAALRGHRGPTRQDDRARVLIERMTQPPMFSPSHVNSSATRSVCWARTVTSGERDHISLDSQVAEALAWAWTARRALALSRATAERIAAPVDRCARHPAWRFPHVLKNQINWNAQLYASAALVTARCDLLRRDYRRHLAWFVAGIRRPSRRMLSTNLGAGLGFHYSPHLPASVPPCARSGSAWAGRARRSRRRSTPSTATPGGSRSRRRATRPRSCRTTAAPSPTAAPSSRACSDPGSAWPRTSAASRRTRSGS